MEISTEDRVFAKDSYIAEIKKSLGDNIFVLKEPFKGYDLVFAEVPVDKLEVVVYQRKPSKPHVRNLSESISTLGFVVPLVVAKKPHEDRFIILDGQHRYLACLDLGIRKIPSVVIPWELATLMINLNIEKQPNIKEKSYVALRVYKELCDMYPEKREAEDDVIQAVEEIFYVTAGLVYEKEDKFSGASWETILKKSDWPLDLPLKQAINERQRRADILLENHYIVKEIVEQLKALGISHPFVYKEVVSYANPIKRKKVIVEFDEVFQEVRKKLEELKNNPEQIRGIIEEGEGEILHEQ